MSQLTLRQLPKEVEINLKTLSKRMGKSLNKTTILLLEKAMGLQEGAKKKRDLSSLSGTWTKKEWDEFSKNTRCFEEIDEELWK